MEYDYGFSDFGDIMSELNCAVGTFLLVLWREVMMVTGYFRLVSEATKRRKKVFFVFLCGVCVCVCVCVSGSRYAILCENVPLISDCFARVQESSFHQAISSL